MATGGALATDDTCKTAHCGIGNDRTSFTYTKPYDWHFCYRNIVDDHNNLRHALPSLEATWVTDRWALLVFTFLLAITEVNCYLAFKFFVWGSAIMTLIEFRRMLAWALINNPFIEAVAEQEFEPETTNYGEHDISTAPNHASMYRNRSWVCEAKQPHQQYTCKWKGCSVRTRNYCVSLLSTLTHHRLHHNNGEPPSSSHHVQIISIQSNRGGKQIIKKGYAI
ncbi:hypothetical protein ACHAWO_009912 [Cyclotella atomus]|uniref:Glycerophosphocholine acyltransferase 1 n=1 Tax=Cyclotella atomus TaxID=382360 RepID=A0ABD3NTR6_9STRA